MLQPCSGSSAYLIAHHILLEANDDVCVAIQVSDYDDAAVWGESRDSILSRDPAAILEWMETIKVEVSPKTWQNRRNIQKGPPLHHV
jgi:hypothetical protein